MLLSQIELAAFDLSTAWGKSFDVQTDQGETVLTSELRSLMIELHLRVKEKKKELSELQKKRIEKAKGLNRKIGRPVIVLPIEEIRKRLDRTHNQKERAQKVKEIAKEFGVCGLTILRKVGER